jgi:molybdopterin molybdotransferase
MKPAASRAERGVGLISLRGARRLVLEAVRPLPARRVGLDQALGCVTADALVAPADVPALANSAMDGFAVRSQDTTGRTLRLRVVGEVRAGHVTSVAVTTGQCVRIMTGAPLPAGTDAVVPVESTQADGNEVILSSPAAPGDFVRAPGSDVVAGQELFPRGTRVTPRCIGVLAASGIDALEVVPRPRVGVLSTGDELSRSPGTLGPGMIRDANGPALRALVRQAGFEVVDLGVVRDDAGAIAEAVSTASKSCEVLVTSGGVSVGDADLVKVVLDELSGGTMRWMQVAIRPAKPFVFGMLQASAVPVFGLAGNPVSAAAGFLVFVLPALRTMAGLQRVDNPVVAARVSAPIRRVPDGKLHLVRVTFEPGTGDDLWVRPSGGQGSHMALSLALADGLALIADGPGTAAGDVVDVLLLDPEAPAELAGPTVDDALALLGQP